MNGMDRLLGPLKRRIMLMIGRAVVELVNDGVKLQGLQISLLEGEVRANVERFQNYGITSHPLPGAEAIAASVMGNRDHCVVIAVDDRRYRLQGLEAGEVALYDDLGQKVHLTRTGIVIDGAGHSMTITNVPVLNVPDGDVVISGISFLAHVHPENDAGGPTGVPQ